MGVLFVAHGADVAAAGIIQTATGKQTETLTYQGIHKASTSLGASDETAQAIAGGVDGGLSLSSGIAGGIALKNTGTITVKVETATSNTIAQTATNTSNISKTIHSGKQGKHIVGHNNYQVGKSTLKSDAQSLLDDFHIGNIRSSRVINESKTSVDFGKTIGDYVDPLTGIATPTNVGTIINSKTGAHIVPARPN